MKGKGKAARLLVAGFFNNDLGGLGGARWRFRALGCRCDGGSAGGGGFRRGPPFRGLFPLVRGVRVGGSSDFGRGVRDGVSSSGSGVGLGLDFFFGGCWAGFGLRRGVVEASGVGVGTVRMFSRALRKSCFFSSSVSSPWVIVPANPATRRRAQSTKCQRRMMRGRIKAREMLCWLRFAAGRGVLGTRGGVFGLAAQDGIEFSTKQQEQAGEIHPG